MRLPRLSLAGFRDPVRRPRYIIWTITALFALAALMILALGATSTRWFCAEVCHKVQDDTIRAYAVSAHAEISCMACHEPVNADTVTFLLAKIRSLGEIPLAVGNTFTLPLNKGSALALTGGHEMGSQQCTQCHSTNRKVTPARGLKMDHDVHAKAGIWCTVCHNRVAHNENDAPPTLTDPRGVRNTPHPDFMTMDGCYRCHDLGAKVKMAGAGAKAAPGTCSTCHTPNFKLTPESHETTSWARTGHAEAAKEAAAEYTKGLVEQKALEEEGIRADLAAPVNSCFTCHDRKTFCDTECHGGVELPHPASFAKKHKSVASKNPQACVACHETASPSKAGRPGTPAFCNECHHKGLGADAKAASWLKTHKNAVHAKGAAQCFPCHSPVYCAKCHVKPIGA